MSTRFKTIKIPAKVVLLLIIFSVTIIFTPSFSNFFAGDDFYNIRLSQTHNILADFNLFAAGPKDFLVYRPLTVQLYWWLGQHIFGLEVINYHLINYLFFTLSVVLTYSLSARIGLKKGSALLAAGIMAVSSTHFYRLYFLTQIQELALVVFVLSSLICYFSNKKLLALIFFAVALGCKESAVVVPLFLIGVEIIRTKRVSKGVISFILLALLYGVAHKYSYGMYSSGAYEYVFSLKPTLNNAVWYFLWTLGIPEAYVNTKLFSSASIINPELFSQYGPLAKWILASAAVFLTSLTYVVARSCRRLCGRDCHKGLISLWLYGCFLLPVLFFPFHKFGYSLTLPIVGFSIFVALCLYERRCWSRFLLLASFITLALLTNYYNLTTHWSRLRSQNVAAIYADTALRAKLSHHSGPIYIRNTLNPVCFATLPGGNASGQLGLSFFDNVGWSILFPFASQTIYFEDYDELHTFTEVDLVIDASKYQHLPL